MTLKIQFRNFHVGPFSIFSIISCAHVLVLPDIFPNLWISILQDALHLMGIISYQLGYTIGSVLSSEWF